MKRAEAKRLKEIEEKNKLVVFKSVKIYCPFLDKEVEVEAYNTHFSGNEQECETCGSHGSVSLSISNCECGNYHSIELESW